jgi:hypothetical protein
LGRLRLTGGAAVQDQDGKGHDHNDEDGLERYLADSNARRHFLFTPF